MADRRDVAKIAKQAQEQRLTGDDTWTHNGVVVDLNDYRHDDPEQYHGICATFVREVYCAALGIPAEAWPYYNVNDAIEMEDLMREHGIAVNEPQSGDVVFLNLGTGAHGHVAIHWWENGANYVIENTTSDARGNPLRPGVKLTPWADVVGEVSSYCRPLPAPGDEAKPTGGGTVTKLQGCDVSLWNGAPDWSAAVNAGMQWVSVKLSQGDNIIDPQAVRNLDVLRGLGIPIMPYHFLYPGMAAADQFAKFHAAVEACGGWEGMLVPALDVEGDENCGIGGMSSDGYCGLASDWLDLLALEIGRQGVVYTYPSFNSEHGVGQALGGKSLLWAASYGTGVPSFDGWEKTTFWQYGDAGSWAGIGNGLDMDVFLGTADDLQALMVGAKVKPLIVGEDGKPIDCKPDWVGDSITVAWVPLAKALGLPVTPLPPAMHENTGRAYLRELEPSCRPWGFFYRDQPQGPRVYVKRLQAV